MNPSIEPITLPGPGLSIKIKATYRLRSISESGTAFFSIGACYTQPYIHNDSIRILHRFLFRFDRFLSRSQLRTVMDKLSSLTTVQDPIFFEHYVLPSMSDYCNRATSMYHDRGVDFLVSVESSGPPVQAANYIDEVLVFDSAVPLPGRGTRRRGSTRGIEKLVRIEDVSAERSSSGQCAICLEGFCRGDDLELGKTPCLHVFHYRCVKRWLERRPTCPLCRSDICG